MLYFIEQCLNGVQLGMLLFLLAAGLTLVFGIMDLVNLAHGSLYMLGAYFAATLAAVTGSFVVAVILPVAGSLVVGMVLEVVAIRRLYSRSHLDHVLGTFGLLLFSRGLESRSTSGRAFSEDGVKRDEARISTGVASEFSEVGGSIRSSTLASVSSTDHGGGGGDRARAI
jgi:branched-subunit amino acid ABC-type transport system permease component